MKQLVYHIIVCGMAVLFLTACEKDDDISGRSMEKNGNSIILNLSSETLLRAVPAMNPEWKWPSTISTL